MALGDSTDIHGAVRSTHAEAREHELTVAAKRICEIPAPLQMRLDYDVRTDDQPIYLGYAPKGLASSTTGWEVFKFTYDSSSRVTLRQVAFGAWDSRASLSYT